MYKYFSGDTAGEVFIYTAGEVFIHFYGAGEVFIYTDNKQFENPNVICIPTLQFGANKQQKHFWQSLTVLTLE